MPYSLQITEEEADGTHTVHVEGELDIRSAPALCARLETYRGRRLVVDLTQLGFCDSCGLRALICEAREARVAGGRMTVMAPEVGPVAWLFDVTGTRELLGHRPDRPSALASG